MKKINLLFLFFLAITALNNTVAQSIDTKFEFDMGVKATSGNTGIGVDGILIFQRDQFGLELNLLNFNFVPTGTPDGYREEETSDGRTICRDTSNGQFTDTENCATDFDIYYGASAGLNFTTNSNDGVNAVIGAGYTTLPGTIYGKFGLNFESSVLKNDSYFNVNLLGGASLFSLSVGITYKL